MDKILLRYRNRDIDQAAIDFIRKMIETHYAEGRKRLSVVLCEAWDWRTANGRTKDMAARDLLLRLEQKGYIELPPRKKRRDWSVPRTPVRQLPFEPRSVSEGDLSKVTLRPVVAAERLMWRMLIDRFHYRGDRIIVGEYILYFAYLEDQIVGCLGWGSSAFRCPAREAYLGWNFETARFSLQLIANNVRFLIPPYVEIKNLASRILSLNLKRLSNDWQERYGHPVYLAETFVDTSRFQGTVYKAANWTYLGQTRGKSKKGNRYYEHGNQKAIYVYPLHRRFREFLKGER